MRCGVSAIIWVLSIHVAWALGPHEVLLLANRNSSASLSLAREYAAMRHIPDANLVVLDLPSSLGTELSPDDFTRLIWSPVQVAARQRRLDDHILAWIYSVDFPVRIKADPPLSIQGLTFLRNRLPDKDAVAKGTYASPLFAGPENPRFAGFPAQSLDVPRAWLGEDMPLPSMALGYLGSPGNTRDEILACLRRGVAADGTRPDGTVYFVTNSDVRSTCRAWQFAPVVRELQRQGLTATITNELPAQAPSLMGLTLGAANVTMQPGWAFVPGAIAEHLTSFGACFEDPGQTKITDWIRAGATASAGTVTEPYSIWSKFPHARVYCHLAAGCTVLESFYQSIRCPLQILLVGEPLAAPWAPASTLSLRGLDAFEPGATVTVEAVVTARNGEMFNRFLFLLDGKILQATGKNRTLALVPSTLPPGHHALRAVAYAVGSVRAQIFAEQAIDIGPQAKPRAEK